MTLQSHVDVENLAHGNTNGRRLDAKCGRAIKIDKPIEKRADRYGFIGDSLLHQVGETVQSPGPDQRDIGLVLDVGAPGRTEQLVEDLEYRVSTNFSCYGHIERVISAGPSGHNSVLRFFFRGSITADAIM